MSTDADDMLLPGLSGRSFVVTGAGSGIGRQVTILLLQQGARVAAVDRDLGRLSLLNRDASSNNLTIVESSLSSGAEARQLIASVVQSSGGVDGLVGSAGAAATGMLTDITDEDWNDCISQNLSSQFRIVSAVLEAAKTSGTGCSIVLLGSKTAVAPGLGFGGYAVAKAGVVQLARIAALEGGDHGVRVNVVNPGAIFEGSNFWTPPVMEERARLNRIAVSRLEEHYSQRNILHRKITPQAVAQTVAFLLSSLSAATTGSIVAVDGGDEHAFSR